MTDLAMNYTPEKLDEANRLLDENSEKAGALASLLGLAAHIEIVTEMLLGSVKPLFPFIPDWIWNAEDVGDLHGIPGDISKTGTRVNQAFSDSTTKPVNEFMELIDQEVLNALNEELLPAQKEVNEEVVDVDNLLIQIEQDIEGTETDGPEYIKLVNLRENIFKYKDSVITLKNFVDELTKDFILSFLDFEKRIERFNNCPNPGDCDEDGIPDESDNCPLNFNPYQTDNDNNNRGDVCQQVRDTDQDGLNDYMDNCPFIFNSDQEDSDENGKGDACDRADDSDGDGITNDVDNCPDWPNPEQVDNNNNGIGDACENEGDSDGDGIMDFEDNCPFLYNPDQIDLDNNGIGDACQTFDQDNDGIIDIYDNCPLIPNPFQEDKDKDGIGDVCEDYVCKFGVCNKPFDPPSRPAGDHSPDDTTSIGGFLVKSTDPNVRIFEIYRAKVNERSPEFEQHIQSLEQAVEDLNNSINGTNDLLPYLHNNVAIRKNLASDYESGYDIAILKSGFPYDAEQLLNSINEIYLSFELDRFLTEGVPDTIKTLVIPSGGLHGLESNILFKVQLEKYVADGGTLIMFSQHNGEAFQALPGGEVSGYGWGQDQSCVYGTASLDMHSPLHRPIFAGQDDATVSANIDGYFTSWPENATILMSRRNTGWPALLEYPYGQGRVIATTMYSDWAYTHGQAGWRRRPDNRPKADEMSLIRDLLKWAKEPAVLNEYTPGELATIPITVVNKANTTAEKAVYSLITPDGNVSGTVNQTITLIPGESLNTSFEFQLPENNTGIWYVDYTLYDTTGNLTQITYEAERFTVSIHQEKYKYQKIELSEGEC